MRSDLFGLVANASWHWPSHNDLDNLGLRWLRTIVYDDAFDDLETALAVVPPGTGIIAVLNSETKRPGAVPLVWEQVVARFAQRFAGRVTAVECFNEWDPDGQHPVGTAGRLAVATAVGRALVAAPLLRQAGIGCLLGSVAGGDWPAQLKQAVGLLSSEGKGLLDGVCLHPYGKSVDGFPSDFIFGELDEAVTTAHNLTGLPIWITEFGVKLSDVAGARLAGETDDAYLQRAWQAQSRYIQRAYERLSNLPRNVLMAACYFCYSDAVAAPTPDEQGLNAFGLVDAAKTPRPAWAAFRRCVAEAHAAQSGSG